MEAHICNPKTQEIEERGQGYMDYIVPLSPSQKTKQDETEKTGRLQLNDIIQQY